MVGCNILGRTETVATGGNLGREIDDGVNLVSLIEPNGSKKTTLNALPIFSSCLPKHRLRKYENDSKEHERSNRVTEEHE